MDSRHWKSWLGSVLAACGALWLMPPPLVMLGGAGWFWLLSARTGAVGVSIVRGSGMWDTVLTLLLWPVLPVLVLWLGQRLRFGRSALAWPHLRPLLRLAGWCWLLLPLLLGLFFWTQTRLTGVGWTFYYPLNYSPQIWLGLACWLVPGLLLLWLSYSRPAQ